jgi:exonuclease III
MNILKIATLNVNGLHTRARKEMLHDFLRKQEIDILYLQEVIHPKLNELQGYTTHVNVGTEMRGTALVTRDTMKFENINKLPSGRGMTAEFRGITLINIYAPSENAKRREREHFFNNELAYLLRNTPTNILLGGDFNCVQEPADTKGHYTYSRALAELVQGFELRDIWRQRPESPVYTHYSPTGATRINRFYTTQALRDRKIIAETVAAAFTDHHAVMLKLTIDIPILRRGRGRWKMNNALLEDA